MTPTLFSIDGYFIDDQTEFSGYLVTEYDDTPQGMDDDNIFFYGLSEQDIKDAIETKEPVAGEFIITSYSVYEFHIEYSIEPKIIITIRDGSLENVISDVPIKYVLVDYDNLERGDTEFPTEINYEPDVITEDIHSYLATLNEEEE